MRHPHWVGVFALAILIGALTAMASASLPLPTFLSTLELRDRVTEDLSELPPRVLPRGRGACIICPFEIDVVPVIPRLEGTVEIYDATLPDGPRFTATRVAPFGYFELEAPPGRYWVQYSEPGRRFRQNANPVTLVEGATAVWIIRIEPALEKD